MTPRDIARRLRRPQRGPSEGRTAAAAAAALRERLRGGPPRPPKPQRLAYGNDVLMDNPPAVRRIPKRPRVAHKDLDNPPHAIEVQPSRGVAHIPTGATADHSIKRTNPSKQPQTFDTLVYRYCASAPGLDDRRVPPRLRPQPIAGDDGRQEPGDPARDRRRSTEGGPDRVGTGRRARSPACALALAC